MKSKIAYLIGGIISAVALLASFVINIVFFSVDGLYDIISILSVVLIFFALVLTICGTIAIMLAKDEKRNYMLVVPMVLVNLFLTGTQVYSTLHYFLGFIFRIFIVIGVMFFILGLCASLQQSKQTVKQEKQEQNKQEQQSTNLNQELEKLLSMKNEGLITDEEFNKLKMNLISKELK